MAILEVRGLVKIYGRRRVVDGIDFTINEGEVVGLLGPNGAGKTTSFRMATGQIVPDGGTVHFAGSDVTTLPMYRRARLGMGYLSQEPSVFRRLSVEENILAVLEMLPRSRALGRKMRRAERWDRCDQVIAQLGLSQVRKSNAWLCSGGEKRRLEIARCLVCEPKLILLDEPFAAVDPITKDEIRTTVRDLARQQNIAILMTDHDVTQVLRSTDRIYLITRGQVRTQGTPQELVRDRIAIDEYLGDSNLAALEQMVGAIDPAPPAAVEDAPAAAPVRSGGGVIDVSELLEGERLRRLVEALRTDEQANLAVAELVQRGPQAVPALLDALERRGDLELRRRAALVLQHICGDVVAFDPFAPEGQRREQVGELRSKLLRKAG